MPPGLTIYDVLQDANNSVAGRSTSKLGIAEKSQLLNRKSNNRKSTLYFIIMFDVLDLPSINQ